MREPQPCPACGDTYIDLWNHLASGVKRCGPIVLLRAFGSKAGTIEVIHDPIRRCGGGDGHAQISCDLEWGHKGQHFSVALGVFWISPDEAIVMVEHIWEAMPEVSRGPSADNSYSVNLDRNSK